MWYETMHSGRKNAYNVPLAIRFLSDVGVKSLVAGVKSVFEKDPLFRTRYEISDTGLSSYINLSGGLSVPCEAALLTKDELVHRMSVFATVPFDLRKDFPIRARIFHDKSRRPVLFLLFHHIAFDMRSIYVFLQDLLASLSQNQGKEPKTGRNSFSDFCSWQKRYLESPAGGASRQFWREYLAGYVPPSAASSAVVKTASQSATPVAFALENGLDILASAKGLSVSPAALFITAHLAALSEIFRRDDVVTGLVVGGRPPGLFDETYGSFVNTLPLRWKVYPGETLRSLAIKVKENLKRVLPHQMIPSMVIAESVSRRRFGAGEVFDTIFNYRHSGSNATEGLGQVQAVDGLFFDLQDIKFESILIPRPESTAPLAVSVDRVGASFQVSMQYDAAAFSRAAMEGYVRSFKKFLSALSSGQDMPVVGNSSVIAGNGVAEPYAAEPFPVTALAGAKPGRHSSRTFRLPSGRTRLQAARDSLITASGILGAAYSGQNVFPVRVLEASGGGWWLVAAKSDSSCNDALSGLKVLADEHVSLYGAKGVGFALAFPGYPRAEAARRYDLTLFVYERDGAIYIRADFNGAKVSPRFASNFCANLSHVYRQISSDPASLIAGLSLVSSAERKRLLLASGKKSQYPDKSIFSVFARIAGAYPDRNAFQDGERSYTYGEILSSACKVSGMLRAKGVGRGEAVALMVGHSAEEIVAMLGILGAGGCYLPLDAKTPMERGEYMARTAKARFILLSDEVQGAAVYVGLQPLYISEADTFAPLVESPAGTSSLDAAYVMFTSGTTGYPKGISIPQKAVLRLVLNTNYIKIRRSDRILLTSSPAFDAATFEIWGALLNGATLVSTCLDNILNSSLLGQTIKNKGITVMWLTAPLFGHVAMTSPKTFRGLRAVLAGGDILPPKAVYAAQKANPGLQVINGYGPTENTTFTACYRVPEKKYVSIPIGKPISNTKVFILDGAGRMLPEGVFGELCTSGDGLAAGYINDPELTEKKFIFHPLVKEGRLYKTGDIARWNLSGLLEFSGRADGQIKVRGFRIELEEITLALLDFPGVVRAVAIPKQENNGEKSISAYIEMKPGSLYSHTELRRFLSSKLPEYMVPSFLTVLPAMPLNKNGKIDTAALPAPVNFSVAEKGISQLPASTTEIALRTIWAKVLGREKIGLVDDFFELGGHSLKAASIIAKINRELKISVDVSMLYANPTISALANVLPHAPHGGKGRKAFKRVAIGSRRIFKVSAEKSIKASHAQQRLWISEVLSPGSSAYNVPFAVILRGDLDEKALEKALEELVSRQGALRTGLTSNGNEILQFQLENVRAGLLVKDSSLADALEEIGTDAQVPFDLSTPPLFRFRVFRLAPQESLFYFNMHHAITDGASTVIFMRELAILYNSFSAERNGRLGRLKYSYLDYARLQDKMLADGSLDHQREYWAGKLVGTLPETEFQPDNADAPRPSVSVERESVPLEAALLREIERFCLKTRVTPFVFFHACLKALINRRTGAADIIVGTFASGRTDARFEHVMGFFVNTLPLRDSVSQENTFSGLLKSANDTTSEALSNQDYPFDLIVGGLKVQRILGRAPLSGIMLSFQNNVNPFVTAGLNKISTESVHVSLSAPKFDIMFLVEEVPGRIGESHLACDYATPRYKRETIMELLRDYHALMRQVLLAPGIPLRELKLPSQSCTGATEINRGSPEVMALEPRECPHQVFERMAAESPGSIAVETDSQVVTYGELNERANQLARHLLRQGARRGQIIAISAERGLPFFTGILSILKIGCAYLPVEPTCPPERLLVILKNSGADIVLLGHDRFDQVLAHVNCIRLDYPLSCKYSRGDIRSGVSPDDLMYVIYTSGSTGEPKGVMISHASAMGILTELLKEYPFPRNGAYLFKTSSSFDVSIPELFMGFVSGHRVVVLESGQELEPESIYNAIVGHQVSHVNFVPSAFSIFVDYLASLPHARMPRLKYVFLAGEALYPSLASRWLKLGLDGIQTHNLYGPTEFTVYATRYPLARWDGHGKILIGRPFPGTTALILDEAGNSLQPGTPGELCLSGKGIALGYLGNEEQTRQKFVQCPTCPGQKMYRTGDIARWTSDGDIEFLGRSDNQVKIRGYRIELDEITNTILSYPNIENAVCMVQENKLSNKYICAYYQSAEAIPVEKIVSFLAAKLPSYMIPAFFFHMRSLPITESNKIDRNKLKPLAEHDALTLQSGHASSTSHTKQESASAAGGIGKSEDEKSMTAIWEDVLGVKQIGPGSNFFVIGGHSLLVVKMLAQIYKKTGIKIPISYFYEKPTIEGIVEYLRNPGAFAGAKTARATEPSMGLLPNYMLEKLPQFRLAMELWQKLLHAFSGAIETGFFQCVSDQQWFVENLPDAFIEASADFGSKTDLGAAERLHTFIAAQTVLHSVIADNGKTWSFRELDLGNWRPQVVDLHSLDEKLRDNVFNKIAEELKRRLTGMPKKTTPLYTMLLGKIGYGRYRVWFCFHHSISDNEGKRIVKSYFNDNGLTPQHMSGLTEYCRETRASIEPERISRLLFGKYCRDISELVEKIYQKPKTSVAPVNFEIDIPSTDKVTVLGLAAWGVSQLVANLDSGMNTGIPLQILFNRRSFSAGYAYDTLGNFHDFLVVKINHAADDPLTCTKRIEAVKKYIKRLGGHLNEMSQVEAVRKIFDAGLFNLNYLGDFEELPEMFKKNSPFPFVYFPVAACSIGGRKLILRPMNGLPEGFLERFDSQVVNSASKDMRVLR